MICNSVGGNEEIIRDGENGIICNDWDSLLNTLNTLPAMTQDIIDCMSENGRRAYLNNFNFKIFKNNYIKLIKSVE